MKAKSEMRLKIKRMPVKKLKPHPENPRKHPEPGSEEWTTLRASLDHDYFDPIVWNRRNGFLVSGHLRARVMEEMGVQTVDVVEVDYDDPTHKARMIAANKQIGEWDEAGLAAMIKECDDLALTGFTEAEMQALEIHQAPGTGNGDAEPQIDRAEELKKLWKTARGQVWELGEHRLMCGDSTSKEDVERLMAGGLARLIVTDPPYGVDYKGGSTRREKLAGDSTPDLYAPAMLLAAEFSDDECPVYLWHSDSKSAAVSAAGYERRCTIIWNKNLAQFGALGAQYKTKHEPCYYLFKKGKAPRWSGPTNEVTVWDIERNSVNEHHPTEKPTEVMARPIRNSSSIGDIVLDFFSGSGSTLIACENLNRKCRAMEIDPGYVAVAIQRWADATGKNPKLAKA